MGVCFVLFVGGTWLLSLVGFLGLGFKLGWWFDMFLILCLIVVCGG